MLQKESRDVNLKFIIILIKDRVRLKCRLQPYGQDEAGSHLNCRDSIGKGQSLTILGITKKEATFISLTGEKKKEEKRKQTNTKNPTKNQKNPKEPTSPKYNKQKWKQKKKTTTKKIQTPFNHQSCVFHVLFNDSANSYFLHSSQYLNGKCDSEKG